MLKKDNRLKNSVAFYATYKQNQIVANNLMALYVGKLKTEEEKTRIGFVVSKKIHKSSVVRNKIKRLMRETVRLLIKDDLELNFKSMIFVAKKGTIDADFKEIGKSIKKLIDDAKKFEIN